MTKQVWKYELNSVLNKLHMPVGAEILAAQVQHNVMCLWALVDVNAPKVDRIIQVVGTGQVVTEGPVTYIDTLMLSDGYLVFHIFERH